MEEHLENVNYDEVNYREVVLKNFSYQSEYYKVDSIIMYRPWLLGFIEKGKGQIGVYRVSSKNSQKIALVKDYIDHYGNWHFYIVNITDSLRKMEEYLLKNHQYGVVLLKFQLITK